MSKLIFLVGLPGCGKSTYADSYMNDHPNTVILSSDDIRLQLWGDANDQQNPSRVFDEMLKGTIHFLNEGQDVIYDATNLVAKTRKATLAKIRKSVKEDFIAQCIFVACPLSECKRRQGDRERKVPVEVIDRMVRQFETPWYNEGWDQIDVVCGSPTKQSVDREHWRMLGESHDNPHHTASLEIHCANCEMNMRDALSTVKWVHERTYTLLIEAAYNHDLGKHKTKAFFDSKGNPSEVAHYYNHNNVGAYLWLTGDKCNEWTTREFLYIALLIQWHMQPFFLRDENGDYRPKFEHWCEKHGFDEMFCETIIMLHEADKAAH